MIPSAPKICVVGEPAAPKGARILRHPFAGGTA
jgi:hypothetical protein